MPNLSAGKGMRLTVIHKTWVRFPQIGDSNPQFENWRGAVCFPNRGTSVATAATNVKPSPIITMNNSWPLMD